MPDWHSLVDCEKPKESLLIKDKTYHAVKFKKPQTNEEKSRPIGQDEEETLEDGEIQLKMHAMHLFKRGSNDANPYASIVPPGVYLRFKHNCADDNTLYSPVAGLLVLKSLSRTKREEIFNALRLHVPRTPDPKKIQQALQKVEISQGRDSTHLVSRGPGGESDRGAPFENPLQWFQGMIQDWIKTRTENCADCVKMASALAKSKVAKAKTDADKVREAKEKAARTTLREELRSHKNSTKCSDYSKYALNSHQRAHLCYRKLFQDRNQTAPRVSINMAPWVVSHSAIGPASVRTLLK